MPGSSPHPPHATHCRGRVVDSQEIARVIARSIAVGTCAFVMALVSLPPTFSTGWWVWVLALLVMINVLLFPPVQPKPAPHTPEPPPEKLCIHCGAPAMHPLDVCFSCTPPGRVSLRDFTGAQVRCGTPRARQEDEE